MDSPFLRAFLHLYDAILNILYGYREERKNEKEKFDTN